MCTFPPNTRWRAFFFIIFFIVCFALIPIFLLVAACIFSLYGGFAGCGGCIYLGFRANVFVGILTIPFAIAFFGISVSVLLGLSTLAAVLAIIPLYFLHIYLFARSMIWWCKPRTIVKRP